jgi:hypothetical protein
LQKTCILQQSTNYELTFRISTSSLKNSCSKRWVMITFTTPSCSSSNDWASDIKQQQSLSLSCSNTLSFGEVDSTWLLAYKYCWWWMAMQHVVVLMIALLSKNKEAALSYLYYYCYYCRCYHYYYCYHYYCYYYYYNYYYYEDAM